MKFPMTGQEKDDLLIISSLKKNPINRLILSEM
jgi:hypothetical protein